MEKIVNLRGLGIKNRQNELIEIALTYKFDAVEIDMQDLLGRDKMMGRQFALQFLKSGRIKVGTFRLPIDVGAAEPVYRQQLADLPRIAELAKELDCRRCYTEIESASELVAMPQNFEIHCRRLADIGDQLAESNLRLALNLTPANHRTEKAHKFLTTIAELLTLWRSMGNRNVGIILDCLVWQQSEGVIEQLTSSDPHAISEVRFADWNGSAVVIPGDQESSFSVSAAKWLHEHNYAGAISIVGTSGLTGGDPKMLGALTDRLTELAEIVDGTRTSLTNLDEGSEELIGANG